MFTGIIRHSGGATALQSTNVGARLRLDAPDLAPDVALGDSVAVNGVCLTVAGVSGSDIEFDVIHETLQRSTLGSVSVGQRVNLETSLRIGDKVDGHFVQGHVDGIATLARRETRRGEHVLWFEPQDVIRPYLIPKGSVALDGVSLTIADVSGGMISAALIPTTLDLTTLAALRVGERVNVETDILARTVVHHLQSIERSGGLTIEHLKAHGFA